MNCKQILELLDGGALGDLTATEMGVIEKHSSECSECARAYSAARAATILLAARVAEAEAVSAPPFFHVTVMNAIRSEASGLSPLAALNKWWKASFSMVTAMLMVVVALVVVAVLAPSGEGEAYAPTGGIYVPDTVIMEQLATREFTDEQALQEIYSHKVEVKK